MVRSQDWLQPATHEELQRCVDPEAFVRWMMTQLNADGSLYLENVVRQYVRSIHLAPLGLELNLLPTDRDVFSYSNPERFSRLRDSFLAAPNFDLINGKWNDSLAAGLNSYLLYLYHLADVKSRRVGLSSDLLTYMQHNYPNGFRFEPSYIRLLDEVMGETTSEETIRALKQQMFCRSDKVWFWASGIATDDVLQHIKEDCYGLLASYHCLELSVFYQRWRANLNTRCIRDAHDFEALLVYLCNGTIRLATHNNTRFVRHQSSRSLIVALRKSAQIVLQIIIKCFDGFVSENDLVTRLGIFSPRVLSFIMRDNAPDLVQTKISDEIHYQTLSDLGIPDNFTDQLEIVLSQLDALSIPASEEALQVVMSLRLGINICAEFHLSSKTSFQRLISRHYKGQIERSWHDGAFMEVGG